ncbi:MAG: ribonuclease H-like domain-containing protein [Chitinophagales bacterium]
MIQHAKLQNILFIDIETVPIVSDFEELSEEMQKLWGYRVNRFKPEDADESAYFFEKAGVYAEFGKIICISAGFFTHKNEGEPYSFRVKSFYGHDEKELLEEFLNLLQNYFNNPARYFLCGHNIREFDIPFMCRRAVIHQFPLPNLLDTNALKPWEVPYLDTMRTWKFGDYKNFTSLHLLATLLEIPTPKQDMEGKDVASVYWEKDNLERIHKYCQQDVIATAQLLLRFKRLPLIDNEQITFIN